MGNNAQIPTYLFTVKSTGEQTKVRTEFPEYTSIIRHSDLIANETWAGIAYEYITNDMIASALSKESARKLELCDDFWDTQKKYCADHIEIVARLVNLIMINGCQPLQYDTFSRNFSRIDGHHRLIVLRFLNCHRDDFIIPFNLSGVVSELERLFTPLDCEYKLC